MFPHRLPIGLYVGTTGAPQSANIHAEFAMVLATVVASFSVSYGLFGLGAVASVVTDSTSIAVVVWAALGLRRVPNHAQRAWTWLVAGLVAWVVGDVGWDCVAFLTDQAPTVSIADLPYLAGYPMVAIGTVKLMRLRSEFSDREGALDVLALAASAMMTAWQVLIVPARDVTASTLAQLVVGAYPVGDVLLLAAVAWLAFTPGRRSRALWYLIGFMGTTLTADVAFSVGTNHGLDGVVRGVNAFYPCTYLLLGLALRDRQIADATEPTHVLFRRTNPVRLAILGATLYTAPLLALLRVRGESTDLWVGLVGTTILSIAVVTRFILLVRARERLEEAAALRSIRDELTGLANRKVFLDRIVFARQRQVRSGTAFAVLFLDLDRFKSVNDTWGHAVGNEVLAAVARVLRTCVRPEDLVARVGGDEFAVLCEDLDSPDTAHRIADRIVAALSDDLPHEAKLVSVSVGVTFAEAHDPPMVDPESLLHRADVAMYRVKSEGGRAWRSFDDELQRWSSQRRSIESDLAFAVERRELRLLYQPIVALDGSACVGLEALLRWERPDGKIASPADFIPVAEATGLVVPIGAWVLQEASRFSARCDSAYVSVNLAALQLKRSDIAKTLAEAVSAAGTTADRLVVELTESALVSDVEMILDELVALGARLAVDDFGTGYSNLAYTLRFPISIVKIDKSLIDHVDTDAGQRAVVKAISGLAQSLNFSVVAEGIERESQRLALVDLEVQYGQGWLFARAMPPLNALDFVASFGERRLTSAVAVSNPDV